MNIAIYKDGNYYKGCLANNDIYIDPVKTFPEISFNQYEFDITEDLLNSLSIPNLGYEKTASGFKIFDKSNETYTEENLPVYVKVFDSPTKTKKWAVIKSPTEDSVSAANEICNKLRSELHTLTLKKDAEALAKKISDNKGIAYVFSTYFTVASMLDFIPGAKILTNPSRSVYIVGTKAQADILELKVPKSLAGKVIGKGGINMKYAAKELGAEYIKVIPY